MKDMFNKDSCRACGNILIPSIKCNNCSETILWNCSSCTNIEEYIHSHNQDKNNEQNGELFLDDI